MIGLNDEFDCIGSEIYKETKFEIGVIRTRGWGGGLHTKRSNDLFQFVFTLRADINIKVSMKHE